MDPHVVEVDGTTDVARWVPVADVGVTVAPILPMVEHVLARQGHYAAGM
ncbi:hypothetical protein [Aeromicrobium sp. UC242_57]